MPRKENNQFFKEQIEKFGTDVKGLNWGSKESQEVRFKIIKEYLPTSGSLVDAGCGFGDFYKFLQNDKIDYLGIDVCEEMIQKAKELYPKARFEKRDILNDKLPKADTYIASGSLNILTYQETYTFIKNCFSSSKKMFIFNILSTHSDFFNKGYNYFSPSELLAYCMSLTSKIVLRHDYFPHDFTIVMYK